MQYRQRTHKNTQRGASIFLVVIFFLIVSLVMIIGFSSPIVRELQNAFEVEKSRVAYFVAEAGIEDAVYRTVNGMSIDASETLSINGGSTVTTITDIIDGKEIVSVSNISSRVRKVRSDLSTSVTGVAFFYGAQVGEGGVTMSQNTSIEGTGGAVGNIYSNGPISGASGATITGDAIVASGLVEDVQARSTVCNQDQIVGKTNPEIDFAQSFSPSSSDTLAKVSLYIKKIGNPNSVNVRIVADNSGVPGTTAIASDTLNSSLVGSNYAWIDVSFSSPATLTSGQTYWIVLDATRSNSKYWIWCSDSNNGFGNGVAKYSEDWDDDPWSPAITGDLTFKTYLGSGLSSISDVAVLLTAKANTITDSSIGGDAYYQTISNTTVTGTSYPGSADPPVVPLPISDANLADWRADALVGGTIVGDCPGAVGCSTTMGPVKIDGNLVVTNGDTLTLTGTIHVTGTFTVSNNGEVDCAIGYGTASCVLLADGVVNVNNNAIFDGSGDPDSYIMVLSDIDGCSTTAIDLSNNAVGAVFYATKGKIDISNGADVTSVVGCTLNIANNGTVTYEVGVSDLDFSSGPGGGWKIDTWKEIE